jgi:hypothetical protein
MDEPDRGLQQPVDERVLKAGWGLPVDGGLASPGALSYRSATVRALWTYTAVAAFTIVAVVGLWMEAQELGILDRVLAGVPGSLAQLAVAEERAFLTDWLYLAGCLAIAFAFLAWLLRTHGNLAAFGVISQHGTPGVLGWWFVPFANFVQPYRVVSEVVRESAADRTEPTLRLYLWWGLWLASALVAAPLNTLSGNSSTLTAPHDALLRTMASDVLAIGSALALAAVVWWTTTRQERRAAVGETGNRPPSTVGERNAGRTLWGVGSVVMLGTMIPFVSIALLSDVKLDPRPQTVPVDQPEDLASTRVSIFDVQTGQCFTNPLDGTLFTLKVVDCGRPHTGEVYAVFDHPAGADQAYPGDDAVDYFAEEGCRAYFQAYTGESFATSPLGMWYLYPGEGTWRFDDRQTVCILGDMDGKTLQGSAQRQPRALPATPDPARA